MPPGLGARNPLIATSAEPLCDIQAQFAALIDKSHPKRAMWVSVGTSVPEWDILEYHDLDWMRIDDVGVLIAGLLDCRRLAYDPCEEQLAEILGYTQSKVEALAESLPGMPLALQARAGDAVVLEQLVSVGRFREAVKAALSYGEIHVMTMDAALRRRERLIAQEMRDAQRLEGRQGRNQAEA